MSKKSAKAGTKEVSSYDQGDIVLGKVRGYPPWPARIVDPDIVPSSVSQERPVKKAHFYCVQFFPAGDFAWLMAKDISKLQTHEIQSYINEPYKKSGDLLTGYRIALNPTKWEEERQHLISEQGPEDDGTQSQIDELDSDGGTTKRSKPKKRKRESDNGLTGKTRKPAKSKDASEANRKKSGYGRKNGPKSKAMVESEDEAGGELDEEGVGVGKKESPPVTKKARREKVEEDGDDATLARDPEAVKVREWRHRLQKAFLGKNVPDPSDMHTHNTLFSTVEVYDKINIQYLQFSKIGKVMRHIAVLPDDKVPRDEEFRFRDRAKALVEQWHQILNANKPSVTNGTDNSVKEKVDGVDADQGVAEMDLNVKGQDVTIEPDAEANGGDADADAVAETPAEDVPMTDA